MISGSQLRASSSLPLLRQREVSCEFPIAIIGRILMRLSSGAGT